MRHGYDATYLCLKKTFDVVTLVVVNVIVAIVVDIVIVVVITV